MSLHPEAETLRNRVHEEISRRWEQPVAAEPGYRIAAEDVERTSQQVLEAMLTRPYRMTPFPSDDEYQRLLTRVRHWITKSKAIRVRIGYGPMKNLNTTRHSRADWAEFFALTHLCSWHNKVRAIYSPGLRIKIVFDDSTIRMANRHNHKQMQTYMKSVAQLVQSMGYKSFIVGTMRQSSFAWLFHFGLYQWAERRVRAWEAEPANQEQLSRMTDYARRNLVLPPGLDEDERERRCDAASHRYRVYNEALQLSQLPRLGHSLIAMYLDGTQHHAPHKTAFHLTSLGKGQVTQPWQGEGALCDNGHGKLVPLVLTARRREEFDIVEVDGLNLVPQEGFATIQVCSKAAP